MHLEEMMAAMMGQAPQAAENLRGGDMVLVVGVWNFENISEMINLSLQSDKYFQMGWNHQLVVLLGEKNMVSNSQITSNLCKWSCWDMLLEICPPSKGRTNLAETYYIRYIIQVTIFTAMSHQVLVAIDYSY